jgi:hypothetical protein
MTIDKRINYRIGSNIPDRNRGQVRSRPTPSAPKRTAPNMSGLDRQQYSAVQTQTGAVKGGGKGIGTDKKGNTVFDTSFVSGDRGRDSRNEFIRNVQKTNPGYTGRPTRNLPTVGEFFGGIINSLPGLNFLRNLNQRIRNTDFARSKNLMDYLDIRKFGGYDEREMARRINLDEAKLLQDRIDAGEFGGIGSLNFGDTTVPRSSYDMAGVLTPFAQPAPEEFVSKFLPNTDIFNQQTTSYQKRPEEVETDIFFRPQIKPEEGGIFDLEIPGFTVEDKYVDALTFPTDDGSGISLMNRSILRNAGYNDSQIKEAQDAGYLDQLIRDIEGPIGGSAFG